MLTLISTPPCFCIKSNCPFPICNCPETRLDSDEQYVIYQMVKASLPPDGNYSINQVCLGLDSRQSWEIALKPVLAIFKCFGHIDYSFALLN